MAKLTDKFFNRVIEGDLELESKDSKTVIDSLKGQNISVEGITSKGIANTGSLANTGNVSITGNLSVSGTINGEESPSVKPIYCHPIYISYSRTAETILTLTCLIFNNDSTPFTKTSFVEWLLDLFNNVNPNASIMASGYVGIYPISRLKIHPENPATQVAIEAVQSSGASNNFYTLILSDTSTFTDGVNKIN